MKKEKKRRSFRSVLSVGTLICWIMPIVIVCTAASVLLSQNYDRNLRASTESAVSSAMRQMEIRLGSVLEDSKAVSYDGIVRQAYWDYQHGTEQSETYRAVTDYLVQKFSRNVLYRTVLISFLEPELDILPYAAAPGVSNAELVRRYNNHVLPAAREISARQDVGIFFTVMDDRLYMIRNLLDTDFVPYAVLVMELENAELMQSLYAMASNQILEVTLDGVPLPLGVDPELVRAHRDAGLTYQSEVDGHSLTCTGRVIGLNIWAASPMLRWIILGVIALVVPLLMIIITLFYRNINRPIQILIDASSRLTGGQRGYQIQNVPPNSEFDRLYHDFNTMSSQLKHQFEQLYEEQQALQQAKIKALQSQINPHFLNNTLEVINWEARLADNERVCSMIEALSTMLDAAIGRDGRSQVLLSEELKYVEAYLYITKERLGDRLTITRDIDPQTLGCTMPLLILQPILENAVEYDLSRSGGELSIRTFLEDGALHLEVAHDGVITPEGWAKIRAGLHAGESGRVDGRSVGLHNVMNRLTLLYGSGFRFDIRETAPGRILAEIILNDPK